MVENEKIKSIIEEKKKEFIKIMKEYIKDYCVQFKKETMESLFVGKFEELAESMTEKCKKKEKEEKEEEKKEKEGKILDNSSNCFSNGMDNQYKSNNVSEINSNKSNITNPSL